MEGSGTIEVELEAVELEGPVTLTSNDVTPGLYAKLTVSDGGTGIAAAAINEIFTPFFTTKVDSEGLGLSVVHRVVQQAGGGIDVESVVGQGAMFHVYLPCEGHTHVGLGETESTDAREQVEATILIVASEAGFASQALQMLERLGANVLVALSASEAMDLSEEYEETIDVLITEVELPDSDGPALRQRLNEDRPNMECVFLASYSTHALVDPKLVGPQVHVLAKPLTIPVLRQTLLDVVTRNPSMS